MISSSHRGGGRETPPALIEVSKIEALDVNEPIDFEIAQSVYRQLHAV